MNQSADTPRRRRVVDHATAVVEQMEHYCVERPGSPSAVRRPQLFFRGDLWIALLGPNVEEGIMGIGSTVGAALRAFDAQYLAGQRGAKLRSPAVVEALGAERFYDSRSQIAIRIKADRTKKGTMVTGAAQRGRGRWKKGKIQTQTGKSCERSGT